MDVIDAIEREAHVGYIHCRKNTGTILKSIIIINLENYSTNYCIPFH